MSTPDFNNFRKEEESSSPYISLELHQGQSMENIDSDFSDTSSEDNDVISDRNGDNISHDSSSSSDASSGKLVTRKQPRKNKRNVNRPYGSLTTIEVKRCIRD